MKRLVLIGLLALSLCACASDYFGNRSVNVTTFVFGYITEDYQDHYKVNEMWTKVFPTTVTFQTITTVFLSQGTHNLEEMVVDSSGKTLVSLNFGPITATDNEWTHEMFGDWGSVNLSWKTSIYVVVVDTVSNERSTVAIFKIPVEK